MGTIGNNSLLNGKLLALLCSRAVPGAIILPTLDFMRSICETNWFVISGFQSPIEQACLEILLKANHSVIVCPARSVERMRVPTAWKPSLDSGSMLITSPFEPSQRRATATLAEERNRFVVSLADTVLVPHAAPGGNLDRLCREQSRIEKPWRTFDAPENKNLIEIGIGKLPDPTSSFLSSF